MAGSGTTLKLSSVIGAEVYSGHVEDDEKPPTIEDRRTLINEFVERHLDEDLSVEDLATELSLSPSRTIHVLKQVTGQTFSHVLRRARLRHAAHLLTSTDLPIGEVAWRCGLADQSYFSRLFKSEFATTPRAYRNQRSRRE